ncbi:hypothetical protein RUND412_007811 [Rhizina undulata]
MGKDTKAKGKSGKPQDSSSADKPSSSKLKPANAINVRHILCEKHSKMEEVLKKLGEGAKFDQVAREMSEDKARQGGSLGWKTRGSLLAAFETAAYQLPVSTVDKPVYTNPAVKTSEGCTAQALWSKEDGEPIIEARCRPSDKEGAKTLGHMSMSVVSGQVMKK